MYELFFHLLVFYFTYQNNTVFNFLTGEHQIIWSCLYAKTTTALKYCILNFFHIYNNTFEYKFFQFKLSLLFYMFVSNLFRCSEVQNNSCITLCKLNIYNVQKVDEFTTVMY